MTTYKTTQATPPAAPLIRIRRAASGPWQPVPLLASAGGWVQVDDQGPLWVMVEAIHPGDWPTLAALAQLKQAAN